jgi:hypothetical protein
VGRDPFAISPQIIKSLDLIPHPHGAKTSEDLLRLSRIAAIYQDRHRALLRAARHGKLPATHVEGKYEVRPIDFLSWFERQGGQAPWNALPIRFMECIRRFHRDAAPPPPPVGISGAKELAARNAKKGKADLSSLGAIKDKRGVAESWNLMRSEMSQPLDKRQFRTMKQLQVYCENKLGIAYHDFQEVRKIANNHTGLAPYPAGRPRKAK